METFMSIISWNPLIVVPLLASMTAQILKAIINNKSKAEQTSPPTPFFVSAQAHKRFPHGNGLQNHNVVRQH